MLIFRRITTHNRFIPQIDGLRFVAISSVVFFHIYAALESRGAIPVPVPLNLDLPKRGVELFFAISGFILGIPFASHYLLDAPKVNLEQYFLRRLTRLEPPYFLSFPFWAAMQWVAARRPLSDMGPHLLAHGCYIHNLVYGAFPGAVNSVAWSLEVEIQFYLLVPLLSTLFMIRRPLARRFLTLLLMGAIGFLSTPVYRSVHFHYSIAYFLAFFLAGFFVCDLYVTRGDWKKSYQWDLLALCLWPTVWVPGRSLHIFLPFVIVVLYVAAFRGRILSAVLGNPLVTSIGGMCYSIYLFHFLVIYGMKHLVGYWHVGTSFWVYFAFQNLLMWPPILLCCGVFFLLIERPCMDRHWPQKLRRSISRMLGSGPYATEDGTDVDNAELLNKTVV